MKRKMFLLTDFFPYGTGETFIMTEVCRLCQHFDITVIPRYKSKGLPRPLPEGVTTMEEAGFPTLWTMLQGGIRFLVSAEGRREQKAIRASGKMYFKRMLKSASTWIMAENIWKNLKKNGVVEQSEGAIFYSFWYTASAIALSHHRDELPGGRVIVRTHNYDLYDERATGGRQPFKPAADDGIDRVVFCCDYGKDYYHDAFCVPASKKYMTIAIGTENTWEMKSPLRSDTLRLVSCSAAVPVKRIEKIIDALAEIRDFSVEWLHIGGGALLDELKARASEKLAGLDNISWKFSGAIPNDAIQALYRENAVDGFITTTEFEGSPISIQEAMSYGIPIVGTAVGGIPEMLDGTNNYLLSANPTAEETAAALCKLHNLSDEEYYALHMENRRRWEEKFNADNNMEMLTREIESLWAKPE